MKGWLKLSLIGAAIGVAAVVLAGAVYGGVAGIQLSIEDGRPYHRPSGLDGAFLGAILSVVLGGLPAAALGAFAGVAIGRHRACGGKLARTGRG